MTRLDRISQLLFVVMCVAVTGAAAQYILERTRSSDGVRPDPVAPGLRLSQGFIDALAARPTLVLALSTRCRFCTDSMPFYRQLAALTEVRSGRVDLTVASFEAVEQMQAYLTGHSLAVARIVGLKQSGISIKGTPTLILVDSTGQVVKSWGGWLNPPGEAAVRQAVVRAAGPVLVER